MIVSENEVIEQSSCERDGCCQLSEDGNAMCAMPVQPIEQKSYRLLSIEGCKQTWQKIRGGVMFGVACLASPCCTPLIVPLGLSLIAGSPIALWLGQNLGWVYGGLTLLSILSFILAFRWMGKPKSSETQVIRTADIPVLIFGTGVTTDEQS